jgi:hypothetical protein
MDFHTWHTTIFQIYYNHILISVTHNTLQNTNPKIESELQGVNHIVVSADRQLGRESAVTFEKKKSCF